MKTRVQRKGRFSKSRLLLQRIAGPEHDEEKKKPDGHHEPEGPEEDQRIRPVLGGEILQPWTLPVKDRVTSRLKPLGMVTSKRFFSSSMFGQANTAKGAPSFVFVSQCASMAASLAG